MAWADRFVRADAAGGGDGTTDTASGANGAWTLAEAVTNESAGMRLNVKAGTYANTTTTRTLAASGTTTAPIWWRGFNSSPGDLDASHALALPSLTFTTGQLVISGAHHILSNLDINGACVTSGGQINWTGANGTLLRCRSANTAANAAARALSASSGGSGFNLLGSWLQATATAGTVANMAGSLLNSVGNVFRGGGHGVIAANSGSYLYCVFDDNGTDGINAAAGISVIGCSFFSAGSDGVELTAIGSANMLIANNLFVLCGGWGINNSTGTNTNQLRILANGFYGNTSGNLNGITEGAAITDSWPAALLNVQLGSNPFTDATNHDFSATTAAKAMGFPGAFENESYVGYLDLGAVQRQEPGGGGGGPIGGGGLSGGLQ